MREPIAPGRFSSPKNGLGPRLRLTTRVEGAWHARAENSAVGDERRGRGAKGISRASLVPRPFPFFLPRKRPGCTRLIAS